MSKSTETGMQLGVYTFGDLMSSPQGGQTISAQQRLQEVVAAAKLADEAGLDVFGVGEHHRLDFAVSSPAVVMAAIAQVTQRINLTSAVTVLSTLDPVRVFQDFATLDLLSNGRAEITAGRGAFIESFPLFGYNTDDYNELFPEKLDLLMKLNESERITWRGQFRTPLNNVEIAPRPLQKKLPIWVGVGGTPESAARAGYLGLPMALGIIGGAPARFSPLVDLYRQAGLQAGHPASALKVGVTSHFHVEKDSQKALDNFYPYYSHYFGQMARSHGRAFNITRSDYDQLASLHGAVFVGSPQQIIDKLLYQHEIFKHQRFLAQVDIGGQPYAQVAESIELFANEVAPVVRRETAKQGA